MKCHIGHRSILLVINNYMRIYVLVCITYLVRLEVASQRAAAAAARRSAAASTMPLHHRDGHHSRVAPPRHLAPSPHHHPPHRHYHTDITMYVRNPRNLHARYLITWGCYSTRLYRLWFLLYFIHIKDLEQNRTYTLYRDTFGFNFIFSKKHSLLSTKNSQSENNEDLTLNRCFKFI